MADPRNRFGDDALLRFGGNAMLAAARAYMDTYALEIFDLWFSGTAPNEVIFDNPKWAAYMQADAGLGAQIDAHLTTFALKFRDESCLRDGAAKPVAHQPYRTVFHAEVGSASGGYRSGYSQLHGSNQTVGDFQMQGTFSMKPGPDSKLEFAFTSNQLTFNDKVDPNFRYKSDATFANIAKNVAAATNGHTPKDYILRIVWREPGPWTYGIPAAPSKPGAPDWLRQFPNRP